MRRVVPCSSRKCMCASHIFSVPESSWCTHMVSFSSVVAQIMPLGKTACALIAGCCSPSHAIQRIFGTRSTGSSCVWSRSKWVRTVIHKGL